MHFSLFYPRVFRNFYSWILFPDHALLLPTEEYQLHFPSKKKEKEKKNVLIQIKL